MIVSLYSTLVVFLGQSNFSYSKSEISYSFSPLIPLAFYIKLSLSHSLVHLRLVGVSLELGGLWKWAS